MVDKMENTIRRFKHTLEFIRTLIPSLNLLLLIYMILDR